MIGEEGDVLRHDERYLLRRHLQSQQRRVDGASIQRAVGGARELGQRLHHREVLVIGKRLAGEIAIVLAAAAVAAQRALVAERDLEVGVRIAVVEVQLREKPLEGLDQRGDEADGGSSELGVEPGIERDAAREGGHGVGEEPRGVDVGVPFVVAVDRHRSPGRHQLIAEKIVRAEQGTSIVTLLEQLVRDPTEASIGLAHLRVERRDEVEDLNKGRRGLAYRPERRQSAFSEGRSELGLVLVASSSSDDAKSPLKNCSCASFRTVAGSFASPMNVIRELRRLPFGNRCQSSHTRRVGKGRVTASALSCLKYWPGPSAPFRLSWETPGWLFRKR